jgi:pilus assembly protein CpaF
MRDADKLRDELRERLSASLQGRIQVTDREILEEIDREIDGARSGTFLPLEDRLSLRKELFNSFRRLDILQELVDNRKITEIMVNGKDCIFVEEEGKIHRWDRAFRSEENLQDLIQQIVSRVNRTVNISRPIADARLPDGSRVHVVLPPAALDGPVLTIRKFPEPFDMDRLTDCGTVTPEAAEFLKTMVIAGYNIFISGGTGSGKTTFLNALSGFIPPEERIITIEDSAELQIRHIPNLVRLETRTETGEGVEPVTMSDLIRASLRMRPDRIIVGEVRGGEALDMLQAMNTGHDGSISTGHANSAADMLTRLETMVLMQASSLPLEAIRQQIASALDIIIHLGRMRDRSRRVLEIEEVTGCENGKILLSPLYTFRETGESGRSCVRGRLEKTGELVHREKLRAAGLSL